ncbi:MAG: hypothetical protein U1E76_21725 [Planctomycetota bacterium]
MIALTSNSSTSALTAFIDETDADPITGVDVGSLAQMTTNHFSPTGTQLNETRKYFAIPASEPGSDGTHYDPTLYGYDSMGHRWRVKEASSTIYRTVFDKLGRVTERWIGTNDHDFSGGEAAASDNMVKTEALAYDSGGDKGNSDLTSRTLYVQGDTTGERVTTYSHDVRGNVLLETNATAPHAAHKYDNMNRRIATGLFSSTGSFVVGTDDPTTETSNRMALSQTFYDQRRQAWKTQRHKIDDADGSDDDNLQTLSWFDPEMRLIKRDGETLEKVAYDRIGRQLKRFVLASDNDSVYADADDVGGDVVLEEDHTLYDASDGKVIFQARIDRNWNDSGISQNTGALDTNADADDLLYTASNLKGRIQITAIWNGLQGVSDVVEYGTYNGSDFDRDGLSVPSRSDTALRTSYVYNTDGTLQTVTDPRALVSKYEYDAEGRKTKEVKNYDAGVNSGNPSGNADNQTVLYAYTDGLMTSMTADLPAGQTDQVTTYTYGTPKGASAGDSKIATGHLLKIETYPDSQNSDDVVKHAYNAQGEEIWHRDQAGNIVESDYDDSGRETQKRVSTLASGFDGAVRRIARTYTSLGQELLVTQYDNATVGSGSVVNEVKTTYDDWGNVEKYEEDRDSAVAGGGNDYEVSYTYAKATSGRNTVRRSDATLPSGNVITYEYLSTNNDDKASRLSRLKDGSTALVKYDYLGVGNVVGTTYDVPDAMWKMYTSSTGDYPDLDRFNRVTTSKWTKDLATDKDFYKVALTYDRNSNPTVAVDQVHTPGFDVKMRPPASAL